MKKYLYRDLYKEEDRHWWHQAKRTIVIELIKKISKKNKLKIADIGCGTGKNIESLNKFGDVWGIDTSAEAIRYCKKRGLKNIHLGDALHTKLRSSSFDTITLLDVLEHTDDNKTLIEMRRIIKPGGFIIITVPALPWMWSQWDVVLHHKRRYTKNSLISVLKKNNFKIMTISYMYMFLVVPALVVRGIKKLINNKGYESDFSLSSPLLNIILGKLAAVERYFIKRGLLPIGLSLIVLAQKKQ